MSKTIDREIKGWKKLAEDECWLKPSLEYLENLPNPPKDSIPKNDNFGWEFHSKEFFADLKKFSWKNKKVLDLGAGRCWTTKELTKKGAICTGLDIMSEFGVGVDTAQVYFDQGYKFETVVGDMNNLPFDDECFDVVYSYASMHHTDNLPKTLSEAYRVLKPGGNLVLSGEPIGTWRNVIGNLILHNKFRDDYGLNETTPFLSTWLDLLSHCKFSVLERDTKKNLFLIAVK